jgi:hypothetical protein
MRLRSLALVCVFGLLLAGCGGGSSHHVSPPSSGAAGAGGSANAATSTTGPAVTGGTSETAASNGVAAQPPQQILAAATHAIDGVRSVQVAGSVMENGIPVRLDLHLSAHHGGEGEVSENGLAFRLISTGKVLYIQGSSAFWTHFGGARAAKLFQGKWLKVPNAGQFATLGALATIPGAVSHLLAGHGTLARSGRTTINGRPAVVVADEAQGGTLFVSSTGQPYPLEILKRGQNGGDVKFSDFNQPVRITPPAHAINLPGAG